MTQTPTQATGGTQAGATTNAQVTGPGSLFGVPKYSTRRRFVVDNGNQNVAVAPNGGSQVPLPTTELDQLDIVTGIKIQISGLSETWTNTGASLVVSEFFPSNIIQSINFKLQAAYNSFNLTGPLAALMQHYRPMWGSRASGLITPDNFAKPSVVTRPTFGTAYPVTLNIDVPLAIKFDEYFDLNATGDPQRKIYDAIVTPAYMAAQARSVFPNITMSPQLTLSDTLAGPVAHTAADTTSTFALTAPGTARLARNAFWTANNPAANPPEFPWMYTRDYFTKSVNQQTEVQCLIQNTGVSVGQVLSLAVFCWDPTLNSGMGGVVPLSTGYSKIQLVTGGSLVNYEYTPDELIDRMRSMYPEILTDFPDGVLVLDFALSEDGSYLTNADAINTYLVNGVSLNLDFVTAPGAGARVFVGVEALKMATS